MSNIQRIIVTVATIAEQFNVRATDITVDDSTDDVTYQCKRTAGDLADDLFNSEDFREFCEENDLHGAFDFDNDGYVRFTFAHGHPKAAPVQVPTEPTFTRSGLLDMLSGCKNLEDLMRAERKLIDALFPAKEGE
jgi:hypothetical protein